MFRPDDEPFLAAIIANPDDDVSRLVFADYLDESAGFVTCSAVGPSHGDPCRGGRVQCSNAQFTQQCRHCDGIGVVADGRASRAEFIRLQIELANLVRNHDHDGADGFCNCQLCNKWNGLRRREQQLFRTATGSGLGVNDFGRVGEAVRDMYALLNTGITRDGFRVEYRRGFVDVVTGPLSAFWDDRECRQCQGGVFELVVGCQSCNSTGRLSRPTPALVELCRQNPLRRIVVNDRTPETVHISGGARLPSWHRWHGTRAPSGLLPDKVFQLVYDDERSQIGSWGESVISFHSDDDARSALSTALIKLARAAVVAQN